MDSISINSAVQHEIETLKRKNIELENKIKILNCPTKQISKLNLEGLNELELKLQNDLRLIQKAKQKLYLNNFYCILCLKNQKNVVINQCNHFVLCYQCQINLKPKKCPICHCQFTNITTVEI